MDTAKYLVALTVGAAAGFGFSETDLLSAQAAQVEHVERFEADLSAAAKQCVVAEVIPDVCAVVEAEHAGAVGKCTPAAVAARLVGNIDLMPFDGDEDGVKESIRAGMQLRLPASLVVELP